MVHQTVALHSIFAKLSKGMLTWELEFSVALCCVCVTSLSNCRRRTELQPAGERQLPALPLDEGRARSLAETLSNAMQLRRQYLQEDYDDEEGDDWA